jgi:ABC-type bacteriocin/lantibiotic exporter with double-glycine peptidase domain
MVARLPGGINTLVGDGGVTLSAGEKQRIAIARAALRNSNIVLLDEPAAHLDSSRETMLGVSLAPWLEGKTVIVAAHRHGLVGKVDRTVALSEGKLIEVVPPETLNLQALEVSA